MVKFLSNITYMAICCIIGIAPQSSTKVMAPCARKYKNYSTFGRYT